MNLWQNDILPKTAKVVVTFPSVSIIENRQEQEGSQKILLILLNISNSYLKVHTPKYFLLKEMTCTRAN